jgi:hypothetical protein
VKPFHISIPFDKKMLFHSFIGQTVLIDLAEVQLLSFSITEDSTRFLFLGGDSPFRFWSPSALFLPRE